MVLGTNPWLAYNDFGGSNLYTGSTHVSWDRPLANGLLARPPGAGRRVAVVNPPDLRMAAHVGCIALEHLTQWAGSAGWPNYEAPFLAWAERAGYEIGRPETTLLGVSFSRGGYSRIGRRVPRGAAGYTVHRPEHWVFDGCAFEWGDLLGTKSTVVGYECDGTAFTVVDGRPVPTHEDGCPEGFEILGTAWRRR